MLALANTPLDFIAVYGGNLRMQMNRRFPLTADAIRGEETEEGESSGRFTASMARDDEPGRQAVLFLPPCLTPSSFL